MSIFSERLRLLRTINGNKPQKFVAAELGISRGMLSNYELGTREPDFLILCRMADYYRVSTDYLLGRTDCLKMGNEDYPRILNDIWNSCITLSDKSRNDLIGFIELLQLRDRKNNE